MIDDESMAKQNFEKWNVMVYGNNFLLASDIVVRRGRVMIKTGQ